MAEGKVEGNKELDQEDPGVPMPSAAGMWVGLLVTVAVLVATIWYLAERAHWPLIAAPSSDPPGTTRELLLRSTIADIGQFVSGIAGTLAFLWIILTYRQQSKQLEMQRRELMLQRNELKMSRQQLERMADEAKRQVEELSLARAAAARDGFIRAYDLYGRQLAHQAARLYKIETDRRGAFQAYRAAWEEYERGDVRVFFLRLLEAISSTQEQFFVESQAPSGHRHIFLYCEIARDVVQHASAVDRGMVSLCRRTEWFELLERLEQIVRMHDIGPPSEAQGGG